MDNRKVMMKTREQLKTAAKKSLKGKWTDTAIFALIYFLIIGIISALGSRTDASWIFSVLIFIIGGPFLYAISKYFLNLIRSKKTDYMMLFSGFTGGMFGPTVKLYILMYVKILLWTLLFIVPGIIASLRYSQAIFLLADDKKLTATQALAKSTKMMDGHKWEYFVLGLSFIGWAILAMFTFGVGYLWLFPYMMTTYAHYYENLKK